MSVLKTVGVATAALFTISAAQAATFVKPAGKAGIESSVVLTKGKKKSKAGGCGAYMYYKKGKCQDARDKK